MRVFRIVAMLLALTVIASGLALAQDRTKGSITGVVEDSTGAVVPNAKVTLTGPFGEQTVTTNDRGAFLFSNLNPGQVKIRAELAGFKPAEAPNVGVRLGDQGFVRLVLQPGEVTQAVEVIATAESPIDLTSTTIGNNITNQFAVDTPVPRDLASLVYIAPGVTQGIGTGLQNPSISGASGFENLTVIDGVNVTNAAFGGLGTYNVVHGPLGTGINFDFIKEVQVQTGGFEAQYGQALGGVINVVTKSGGNEYTGGIYQYYAPNQFESTRKQPNANLINPRTEIHGVANYDIAAELGGYFIKDKLFFYGAINPVWTDNDIRAPLNFDMRIRGMVTERQRALSYTAKLTWQAAKNHQFEGSYFADPSQINEGPHVNMARNILVDFREADSLLRFGNRNGVVRYNGTLSPHFVLTLSGARQFNKFDETNFQDVYNLEDITPTQLGTGSRIISGGIGFFQNTRMRNDQFNAIGTVNVDFLGRHEGEFGYSLEHIYTTSYDARSGPNWTLPVAPGVVLPEDVGKLVFGATFRKRINTATGAVFFQQLRGSFIPSPPGTSVTSLYNAAFAQDNWSPNRYFTFKAGLRWEQLAMYGDPRTTGNDPKNHHTFTGNWAPRIGFTIDPGGKNRMKIYGNVARYFEKVPLDLSIRSLSIESSYLGLQFSQPSPIQANYIGGGFLSGGGITEIFPGTQLQYEREFIGGIEKVVTWHDIKLGARFIRRDIMRVLEDMSGITVEQAISDNPPVQTYVVGNPSSTTDIFQNPVPTGNGGFTGGGTGPDGIPDGFADPVRRYWAYEFTADKRFEDVWQMIANYTYSRLSGNYEGLFRNDNEQSDPNITSLFDFITSPAIQDQLTVGLLPADHKHLANFYLSHAFPEYGWNFGIGARLVSGTPISRFNAHPAYLNAGEIPVGGRGSFGRTAVITDINGHADYTWNLSEKFRVRPGIDVFNLLNQQHIRNVDQQIELAPGVPDLDFGKPRFASTARSVQAYQRPIYVRVSLRLEF